jgi:hypothetical protein
VAPRKREPSSRTRRWSKASRPTGTTRVATHGSCAAGGLPSSSRVFPGGSCEGRRTRQVWRSSADAARQHTALGGNGREAASAGGPSEPPPPTLFRRSRRSSATAVRGGCGRADQTAWRQRPQRCGAAAGEDQTFEGSALRGSRPTPSPSGTEPSCHPPGNFGFRRLVVEKRSEPHVRYRDATSPDPAMRRKPSRW